MPDLPDYTSPVDGRLVSGRRQRREDLARHGCRPYEKGEREDWARRRQLEQVEFERRVAQTISDTANK